MGERTEIVAGLHWFVRDGTTDYHSILGCCDTDEYQVKDIGIEGARIIDFGCHVGGFSVWCASRGATVVGIDPVPENIEQVKKNARLNDVGLYVMQAAVGTSTVYLGPEGSEVEFVANGDEGGRRIDGPEVTLDFLCQFLGWVPDILKLDCEGGEWDVFRDPACQAVPYITGEYHPSKKYPEATAEMIAVLLPDHDVLTGDNPALGHFTATNRGVDFGPKVESGEACTSS